MSRPFKRGALVAGLMLPFLFGAAGADPSFDAMQRRLAEQWRASPANCADPVPDAPLTSSSQVSAVKAGLKTYQACLKAAVARVQARKSAETLVGPSTWPTLTDAQGLALQETLETSNREAIRAIVGEGQQVALAAVGAFNAYDEIAQAEQVQSDISKIRSCAARLQRLTERRATLDQQRDRVNTLARNVSTLGLSISMGAAFTDQATQNMRIAEYERQRMGQNRASDLYNERNDVYNNDVSSYDDDCSVSFSKKAVAEACQDGDIAAFCRGFKN